MTEAKAKKNARSAPLNGPVSEVPLANIVLRQANVRSEYTNMDAMVSSIRAEGVIQPVTLVHILDEAGERTGKGELIAGYRRYFAAKKAGLTTLPAHFVSADEHRRHRLAMIENLQREDMNPMDRAAGIKKMMDDESLDQKGAAGSLGVSESYVSQHLALLSLPSRAQSAVRSGRLEMTHARTLGRLKDDETILGLLKEAQTLTASDLNSRVDLLLSKEKARAAKAAEKSEKGSRRSASTDSNDEAPARKSLAEQYADAELAPLNKTDLRNELRARAEKLQNAKTESSRNEHKFVLKGLEIAAGLK